MGISNAVSTELASRVVGYDLTKGNFLEDTPNLPMSIAILGQANTDKQASLGASPDPLQVTSEEQAGEVYGFGSQIHSVMRILRSRFGDQLGGIPTVVYPQLEPAAAEAQVDTITVTGTATAAAVHILRINGRSNYDGASLEISIQSGETAAQVAQKITDAINNARACPVSATVAAGVVTITTKWKGENAADLDARVDVQSAAVGLAYAVAEDTAAAGDSSAQITASLAQFGETWHTIVINCYGKTRIGLFETHNGRAGTAPGTGRYAPATWKPYVALFGDRVADTVANVIAGLLPDENTGVQCPAPNSLGWDHEAAANVAVLLARQAQDSPHRDTSGKFYPDMPVPSNSDAGVYADYLNRDLILKDGGSTVRIANGAYKIEDLATTYHPAGEIPPQFRWVRTLIQDWNVRFGYMILENINVVDHTIVKDDIVTNVDGVIKPGQWRGILRTYFIGLSRRAIINEPEFSLASLVVGVNATNPDRLETFFRYKRTGIAHIASTTAEAGFTFSLES